MWWFLIGDVLQVVGVFAVTAHASVSGTVLHRPRFALVARAAVLLSLLALVARFFLPLVSFLETDSLFVAFWYSERVIFWAYILTLAHFLRGYATRYGEQKLARTLLWLPLVVVLWSFGGEFVTIVPVVALRGGGDLYTFASVLYYGIDAMLFASYAVLIYVFRLRWPGMTEAKCHHCGYSRKGIDSIRCPECGSPFEQG